MVGLIFTVYFGVKMLQSENQSDNTSLTTFIDQYITAELPETESDLYDIVKTVQMHSKNHSKHAKKSLEIVDSIFPGRHL